MTDAPSTQKPRISQRAWSAMSLEERNAIHRITAARKPASNMAQGCAFALIAIVVTILFAIFITPVGACVVLPLITITFGLLFIGARSRIMSRAERKESVIAAAILGIDRHVCIVCGYSRKGIDHAAPCPECSFVPRSAFSTERLKLRLMQKKYRIRVLDHAGRHNGMRLIRALNRSQRRRAFSRYMKTSGRRGRMWWNIISLTTCAVMLTVPLVLFLQSLGRIVRFSHAQNTVAIVLEALMISIILIGLPLFFFLHGGGYRLMLGSTMPKYIRAANHTLDRSCVICDAQRKIDGDIPCPICGLRPPASLLPPEDHELDADATIRTP